ncbi:MAG: hypothetical protein WBC85_12715 [Planktotalea sp.]|uniref:hypothetical protein n=1 Tax=Planktotalea sp. TaxID=2029877 RepID=UPI003C733234
MPLSRLHKINAACLAVFLFAHFSNHAVLLIGRESHLVVMTMFRAVYRLQIIEIALLLLFAMQIVLGAVLIAKRGRPKGRWAWAQVISGAYIAFFLLQHVGAIIMARMSYDFETTTYFAAAVVSAPPFGWYFFPYYVLGITAVFTHVAAAARFARWPAPARRWQVALPFVGFAFGLAVVTSLSLGSAEELPAANRAYLTDSFGN